METRDELKKQYKKAALKLMKAIERRNSFLPTDEFPTVVLTPELIAEFKKVELEVTDAMAEQHEILEKIRKLNQP